MRSPNVAKKDRVSREIDEITLRRAQNRDTDAFRTLVATYERAVHGLLSRLLGPAGRRLLVPDLAQETFIRVFKYLPGFDPRGTGRLSTWILTIGTRVAMDELRARPPAQEILEAASEAVAIEAPRDPHDSAESAEIVRAIERAVLSLSPEGRAVFVLRAHYELEYHEIAEALGIEIGTVRSRLSRVRAVLREILGAIGEEQK
jgi:RNA polymerase sigma-70 factor (ECF subfamily)